MATNNLNIKLEKLEIGKMTPSEIIKLKDHKVAEGYSLEREIVNLNVYINAAEDAEMLKTIFDIYVNAGFTKAQAAAILSSTSSMYFDRRKMLR